MSENTLDKIIKKKIERVDLLKLMETNHLLILRQRFKIILKIIRFH